MNEESKVGKQKRIVSPFEKSKRLKMSQRLKAKF